MEETTHNTSQQSYNETKPALRVPLGIIIAVIVALGVIALALYYSGSFSSPGSVVVASVNGTIITQDELNLRFEQSRGLFEQQGLNVETNKKQVEEQVLNAMINEKILVQQAESAGISVTDEEVSAQLEQVVSQFENDESYQAQLEANKLTEEQLRENIRINLLAESFFAQELKPEVTSVSEDDVRAQYDLIVSQLPEGSAQEIPSFDEVEETLRTQLESQIEAQARTDLIESLRAEAEVELFVE